MDISVRYMRDFKRTYWCTLYLRRKATMVLTSAGILVLLAAFLPSRSSQAATVVLAVIGIAFLVEVPVVIWLMVRRNWDALNEEVEVTVTSEEIVQRTATTSLRLSWDMMQRIISLKDMWLFCADRLKVVTLYKEALTAAQQAELAAFIEARKRLAGPRADRPGRHARAPHSPACTASWGNSNSRSSRGRRQGRICRSQGRIWRPDGAGGTCHRSWWL